MSSRFETVAATVARNDAVVLLFDALFNNTRERFLGRRNDRNTARIRSRIEALQACLQKGDAMLNAMRANTAEAADAFRAAQEARQRVETQLSIMEESSRRRNSPDPYSAEDTKSMADGDFRSTELDRQGTEEERRRVEEHDSRALEERSRAIVEASKARQEEEETFQGLRGAEVTASGTRIEQLDAEDNLCRGIRPVVEPTQAEFLIVLFDSRLISTDIGTVLRDSTRFGISAFIVRSKATQHIQNLARDMPDTDDDDDAGISKRAREMYIQEIRASIARNLVAAGLPEQRVYMVDKDTLARMVKGRPVMDGIDEEKLLRDLLAEARRQKASTDTSDVSTSVSGSKSV